MKRKSPFDYMKKLKSIYCLIQTQSQGIQCTLLSLYDVYVISDGEEMMNVEDVEDEIADDEQPSDSSSRSLVGRSTVVYDWLLTMMQVVKRLKLYVLLIIYFNLLETNAKLILFNRR